MGDLPHNLSFECGLIGGVIYNSIEFFRVREAVTAEDFYDPRNVEIWMTVAGKLESGEAIDGQLLRQALDDAGRLDAIGGAQYLADLLDSAVVGPELRDYARGVSDLSARRQLVTAGRELSLAGYDGDPDTVIDEHEGTLEAIRERTGTSDQIECVQEVTLASLANLDAMRENLIPTGYPSIDNEIGGFQRGTMSVLGARPGMGKTASAICVIGNQIYAGQTVGLFSLEMPSRDIGLRLGCWEAWKRQDGAVPYFSELINGKARPDYVERVQNALSADYVRQLLVDDRGGLTISQMRRKLRDWKKHCRRNGLPMPSVIYVDHMGHARPDDRANGRYEKITEVSHGLMTMAKEFDVAVVALCQLNRASVQAGRRPSLEDLRDSGAIEQDANLVLMLHREDYYLEKLAREGDEQAIAELSHQKGKAEMIIAKARNGPTGSVQLTHSIGHNVFRDPQWAQGRVAA